jgi:transcriptional regulator with XRE-family HTH domain
MTPEDLKTLRRELSCTARELGDALGFDQATVLAWERGELFPTKRAIQAMAKLQALGPTAVPRKKKRSAPSSPLEALADPALWQLIRKLLVHAPLRASVDKLAEAYEDPIED